MDRRAPLLGKTPWIQKTILSAAFGLALLPDAARAQEEATPDEVPAVEAQATEVEEPDADGGAEGGSPERDADESNEAEAEAESTEGEADESNEAEVEAEPESIEGEAEEAAAEEEVEPAPAEPEDPVGTEGDLGADEEPDYFGGYEPLTTPLSTEMEPPKKPPYSGPFRSGAFRVGVGIGGGGYGDQTYFILGGGLGYFLVNGLELHLDTDFWLIGDPFIATPTPGVRYIMWFIPKVHPYVGGFFRHYVVGSGYLDADSVGARGGVYLMTGRNSYFGLGIVYEHMLQDHLFTQTDFYYPEITFAFAF